MAYRVLRASGVGAYIFCWHARLAISFGRVAVKRESLSTFLARRTSRTRASTRRTGVSSYMRTVTLPFADAVLRAEASLKAEGFAVLSQIDIQAKLKEKLAGFESLAYCIRAVPESTALPPLAVLVCKI